jgi:hypothetical protein
VIALAAAILEAFNKNPYQGICIALGLITSMLMWRFLGSIEKAQAKQEQSLSEFWLVFHQETASTKKALQKHSADMLKADSKLIDMRRELSDRVTEIKVFAGDVKADAKEMSLHTHAALNQFDQKYGKIIHIIENLDKTYGKVTDLDGIKKVLVQQNGEIIKQSAEIKNLKRRTP